jgi:hypothetical protein
VNRVIREHDRLATESRIIDPPLAEFRMFLSVLFEVGCPAAADPLVFRIIGNAFF